MSQQQLHSEPPNAAIDLETVRHLFAKPEKIEASAFLRQEIASRMRERLSLVKLSPQRILDAGCGDGADTIQLQRDFSQAFVVGLDASAEMLRAGVEAQQASAGSFRRWLARWQTGNPVRTTQNPAYSCGNYAALPLTANAVDLIWSNLALHWHPRPDAVLSEWRRVLQSNGLLMFSSFGPDTFKELRAAFAAVGDAHAVLPFTDMHDFGDMLVHAGFSTPVMDMETITLTYSSVDKLLSDVRALGGNPLRSRRKSLAGKARWQRIKSTLEASRRDDGLIHQTIEAVYGHAFLPVPGKTRDGESIIHFQRR